jgi:hypothetical protein
VNRSIAALAIFVAGCGCSAEGYGVRDADAWKHNEGAVQGAIARAGFIVVQPTVLERGNPNIAKPAVMSSDRIGLAPGKLELVFPTSREAPTLVRDKSGKIFAYTEQHEVTETRGGRICGCGPNAGGGTPPPPPPAWYVDVDAIDAYGGPVTLVVPGWIELVYSYPEANEHSCHEIP